MEEETLSDEEMCQRWDQVMCEARETALSVFSCKEHQRQGATIPLISILQEALTTPSLVQMAKSNKYN